MEPARYAVALMLYEFPDDFDPQVFVGRQFTSVTFAENVIGLNFDEGLVVSVYCSILYRTARGGGDG